MYRIILYIHTNIYVFVHLSKNKIIHESCPFYPVLSRNMLTPLHFPVLFGNLRGVIAHRRDQNSEEKWAAFAPGGLMSERLGPAVSAPRSQISGSLVG